MIRRQMARQSFKRVTPITIRDAVAVRKLLRRHPAVTIDVYNAIRPAGLPSYTRLLRLCGYPQTVKGWRAFKQQVLDRKPVIVISGLPRKRKTIFSK